MTQAEPKSSIIGQTIGPYRVLEKIGGGGMGVVYKAEDVRLGRAVALKFLPESFGEDRLALERFSREARTASAVNHPNICTIYDVGEHEGRPFIVMELIDGRTLDQVIADGPLELDELLRIGIAIADALDAAHGQDIIHRDVKPANIFITQRGDVKLADFGLAKLATSGAAVPEDFDTLSSTIGYLPDSGTSPGTASGTVTYMSPEQARGEELDARTDLFSLGVVLYKMATGKLPFAGSTMAVVFDALLNRDPAPVRDVRADLSEVLDAIIQKALKKSPADRYQSAAEMRDALKALAGGTTMIIPAAAATAARLSPLTWLVFAAVVGIAVTVSVIVSNRQGAATPAINPSGGLEIRSLAVLPLVNLSPDSDAEFLADGMTDLLTADLARSEMLRLPSRTSVNRYRDSDKSLREIAAELNVDAVVEGSIITDGYRVRITVQLIHGSTDTLLWADSYESGMGNVLDLQVRVSNAIAHAVSTIIHSQ